MKFTDQLSKRAAFSVVFTGLSLLLSILFISLVHAQSDSTDQSTVYMGSQSEVMRKGMDMSIKGQVQQEIQLYTRYLERHPDDVDILWRRGNAWKRTNNSEKAIADFDRALAIDNKYTLAYVDKGNVLLALGRCPDFSPR